MSMTNNKWIGWALLLVLIVSATVNAAPFAKKIQFTQPDGTAIELWGAGDEFSAVFETLDGYTVVFEPSIKTYFYARLSDDRSVLESTGLRVGAGDPATLGIEKHLRISAEARKAQVKARLEKMRRESGESNRWNELKALRHAEEQARTNHATGVESSTNPVVVP
ncbi:MAG: hypothetical protein FJ220_07755 [Kiritimatiellaceae bacterium]|nr:hypothetical protein [Kiritimatiellaceae bacterium]